MTRILGLDVGDKKVGVAWSDHSSMLASPLGAYDRAQGEAERQILHLISEHQISTVIVGMPYSENGNKNEQCEKINSFCRRLRRRSSAAVIYVDEYLSTHEATERLGEGGGAKRKKRAKAEIDAASAAVILQSFLDLQPS